MMILALVGGAVGLLALAAGCWLLVHLRGQQERLEERLDRLTGQAAAPATLANGHAAVMEPARAFTATAGEAAPAFDLALPGGGRAGLGTLLARGKPLMLIFTHPRCGPCYELLPDIGGWQRVYGDKLTIALVSAGTPETNLAMTAEYGIEPVLLQREQEVADVYGIAQMPAALLIDPDGRIAAGASYGVRAIRQLVADALGLALPEAPAAEAKPVRKGEPLPPLRRPDLHGNVINLAAPRREPALLLFWSPGCTHCRDLHPEILALERAIGPNRMVIVSRGPIALNQEAGFQATVVLDDDHSIARTLGVTGTPAAVMLDQRGVVATPVARGVDGVRSAMNAVDQLYGRSPVAAGAAG